MSKFHSLVFLCLASASLWGQGSGASDEPIRVGPGVKPPKPLRMVAPTYSEAARGNLVQGTTVLELVIDEKGHQSNIEVLSPLGYGLDEKAIAAVEKWIFAPAEKNGKPVKVFATIEVNFRLDHGAFEAKAERQRTAFNVALQRLGAKTQTPEVIDKAVNQMQELATGQYLPAMYVVGIWEINGVHVSKDELGGMKLLQTSAESGYGPSLYEIAIRQLEIPLEVQHALQNMRKAADAGSAKAQFYLARLYETGNGVPQDKDRARRFYRLCGAQGVSQCQYRLGTLVLQDPDRKERDKIEGMAWLELAGEQDIDEAKELAERERSKFTPTQRATIDNLKKKLVR